MSTPGALRAAPPMSARAPPRPGWTTLCRDATGWQLTNVGRDFLANIEAAMTDHSSPVKSLLQAYTLSNVVNLEKRRQVRHRRLASDLSVKAAGLEETSVEPLLVEDLQDDGVLLLDQRHQNELGGDQALALVGQFYDGRLQGFADLHRRVAEKALGHG